MPSYDYIADDSRGMPQAGRLQAGDVDAARNDLIRRGWTIRRLTVVDEQSGREIERLAAEGSSRRLPPQLTLRALLEDVRNPKHRLALRRLIDRLDAGEDLRTVVAAVAADLPPTLRKMLELDLTRQQIDSLLTFYLDHRQRRADLRWSLVMALTYPTLLVTLLLLIGLGVAIVIMPQFAEIFESFATELPGLTVVVLSTSLFVRDYWWLLLSGLVLGATAIGLLLWLIGGAVSVQDALRSPPIAGTVLRNASLANFCHLLAALIETEVPLTVALQTAGDATDDLRLRQRAAKAASLIDSGHDPVEAIQREQVLSAEIAPMFRFCDRPADFADALRGAAEIYGARCRVQTGLVGWMLEPVLIVILAVGTGLVVIALFMPLIKLLNDLS